MNSVNGCTGPLRKSMCLIPRDLAMFTVLRVPKRSTGDIAISRSANSRCLLGRVRNRRLQHGPQRIHGFPVLRCPDHSSWITSRINAFAITIAPDQAYLRPLTFNQ